MSKYIRPKIAPATELAAPDRFVSFWQKAGDLVVPTLTRLLGLALVGVVVFAAVYGVSQISGSRKEKATELLGSALRIYQADLLSDKAPPPAGDTDDTPRFKTAKERADATLAALDKLDQEYRTSEAAQRGLLLRAGVHYDLGAFDQAAAAYRKLLDKKPESADILAASREGLGLSVEAQGKLDEALSIYKDTAGLPADYYKDRMLWAQARVLLKKDQKKQAADLYKEIVAQTHSSLKDEAQNRLAALEN